MRKSLIVSLLLLICLSGYAQEDIFGLDTKSKDKTRKAKSGFGNTFRNAIGNVSFEFAGGGAFHTTQFDFHSENPSQYPLFQVQNLENPQSITSDDTVAFRASSYAIPIQAAARINLFNTLTIGAGYGREWGNMTNPAGGDFEFRFQNNSYTIDKAFGSVGLVLYDASKRAKFLAWRYKRYDSNNLYMQSEAKQRIRQLYPWKFTAEADFGKLFIRQTFDENVTPSVDPFYNIGLRVDKEFSEYARFFVKGGVEFRNFEYKAEAAAEIMPFTQNLYFVQAGISISLPSTKRCKVPGCGVVMKHLHDGIEYRGSSIFSPQNRKIGQWY
ncbi:hypothetical protein C943_04203 [Mariniradius saccharolyticus AK6]|uniref:DUF4421 domain-containing protein n=1 Tax=Mariniradius saccharolyticus AK6 TaxID=1239962 RepID=M7XGF6_9BACT|nr:hypothetical protein [Mariniradius saccharolyticus]EMS33884.1 hypothetical protein C943_04203 [Mariniradius saccharolyticus AK6]